MAITFRMGSDLDVTCLAEMNSQLIRDEGHRNRMSAIELESRMRYWLHGEYQAVLVLNDSEPIGYALFRNDAEFVYVRQFFIHSAMRRRGIGRETIRWMKANLWASAKRIRVEALMTNRPAVEFWRSVGFQDYSLTLEMDCRPSSEASAQ